MPRGALMDKDAEGVRCHLHDHRSRLVSAHGVIQVLRASASRIVDKLIQDLFTRKEPNTSYQRWSKGKVRHLAVGDFWVQHHSRSVKIRVFKMSRLENPSDAQTKYLGPEPLLRHTKTCNWVPVVDDDKS